MAKMPERDVVYAAAERFVEQALDRDGSLFSPGVSIWSLDTIDDLHERFIEHPDTSGDPFEVKFERQLKDAPDPTIQLAAELLFVHFLPARSVNGARKRALISGVLSWMHSPVVIPQDLDQALDDGLMNMGVAFNTSRNYGIAFLIDVVRALKRSPRETQDEILGDPWRFRDLLISVPVFAAQAQREALLHLVFPENFEHMASGAHKQAIAAAFADRTTHPDDVDAALADIRASLEAEEGGWINFYSPELEPLWQPHAPAPTDDEVPVATVRHAWLIRGTEPGGQSVVPDWLEGSYVSIGWQEAGEIMPGSTRDEIRRLTELSWPDSPPALVGNTVGIIDRFLNRMSIGDLVAAPNGSRIFVGVITSDPQWRPGAQPDVRARRRSVEWANAEAAISRDSVSPGLYSKMRTLLTLTDITAHADELADRAGLGEEVLTPNPPAELVILEPTPTLAEQLLLPLNWI
jgi:5-methylcytosine-specific restriction protein B